MIDAGHCSCNAMQDALKRKRSSPRHAVQTPSARPVMDHPGHDALSLASCWLALLAVAATQCQLPAAAATILNDLAELLYHFASCQPSTAHVPVANALLRSPHVQVRQLLCRVSTGVIAYLLLFVYCMLQELGIRNSHCQEACLWCVQCGCSMQGAHDGRL